MPLMKKSFHTIPMLMKSFMDAELMPIIPHLIVEVSKFEGFVMTVLLKERRH
jgi:hypothetical protein